MIDGLRGWLALGVFFTHVALMYAYNVSGAWEAPASAFYRLTGEIAVSLFFMITGFLFWTRALRGGDAFDAAALYRSRLRRIVPMYLVSVALIAQKLGATYRRQPDPNNRHTQPMEKPLPEAVPKKRKRA
jgi:peptidoglycan/LPS O-acetylase OafA/YrhL